MNAPTPLPELPRNLRRLTADGSAVRPMTADQREELWRTLTWRARSPRRSVWRPLLVVATTAALVLVWAARTPGPDQTKVARKVAPNVPAASIGGTGRPQARVVHLGNRGELELRADAQLTLPPRVDANQRGTYRVRLEHGQLAAAVGPRGADEPLAVETPQLAVIVVGTRFSVEVSDDLTSVAVTEGRVRVERGARAVFLSAGEAIRSDDPRLADAAPAPCPGSLDDRRACLRRRADGQGLPAENALLALGLLERGPGADRERALALFREYQRRFPTGVLAPEVALAITTALAADGRAAQACAEADAFARRFPADRTTRERLASLCGR